MRFIQRVSASCLREISFSTLVGRVTAISMCPMCVCSVHVLCMSVTRFTRVHVSVRPCVIVSFVLYTVWIQQWLCQEREREREREERTPEHPVGFAGTRIR